MQLTRNGYKVCLYSLKLLLCWLIYTLIFTPILDKDHTIQKTVVSRLLLLRFLSFCILGFIGAAMVVSGMIVYYGNSVELFGRYGYLAQYKKRLQHRETAKLQQQQRVREGFDLILAEFYRIRKRTAAAAAQRAQPLKC